MKRNVILDTGPLVALVNAADRDHSWSLEQWSDIEPCETVAKADRAGGVHQSKIDEKGFFIDMSTVNIEDAQAHLQQIIAGLNPGEPLTITKDGEPVATLTRAPLKSWPCKAGTAKDTSHWMAPDFDAPLEDFRDYME